MKPRSTTLTMALAVLAAAGLPARGGVVGDWNQAALNAIQSSGTLSPYASREMAMMQGAIWDAVNSIDGGHEAFLPTGYTGAGAAPVGADMNAAAAAAAKTVISFLYPGSSGSFDTLYNDQLNGIANSQSKTDGINWGTTVGTAILNWRTNDGASDAASTPYTPSGTLGGWIPTPHSNPSLNYTNPPKLTGWGLVNPFTMTANNQFRPSSINGLDSVGYANDYNQVYSLGDKYSATRTSDQTQAAFFWSEAIWQDPLKNHTSIARWNQIARNMSGGADIVNESLVLAALNLAMADATISAFDSKYAFDRWSPLGAIAYGDADPNPGTTGDVFAGIDGLGWVPLLDSNPFPTFTSLNATVAGAAEEILTNYFGNIGASAQGDTDGDGVIDGIRSWGSISQAADEAMMSEIYQGVGFASDGTLGRQNGQSIAQLQTQPLFAPVPEPSSLMLCLAGLGLLSRRRRQ